MDEHPPIEPPLNDFSDASAVEPGAPPPPSRLAAIRPHPRAAWAIIFGMIALLTLLPYLAGLASEADAEQEEIAQHIELRVVEVEAKIFLAFKYGFGMPAEQLAPQLNAFNDGEIPQRQRYAVIAYEFGGIDAAREVLAEIDTFLAEEKSGADAESPAAPDEATAVQRALRALYGENTADPSIPVTDDPPPTPDSPGSATVESLGDDDRALLREHLGWLGEVAVNPPSRMTVAERDQLFSPTVRLIIAGIVLGILFALSALGGFIGLIVMLVQAFGGRLRSRIAVVDAGMGGERYTGVYIEAAALWLVIHFGLQLTLAPLVASLLPAGAEMAAVVLIFFATLIVLGWPVLRGVPWPIVRRDIGWTLGERPALEPFIGVAGYFMMVTFLAIGILLMLLLMAIWGLLFGEPATPVHPIAGEAEGGALQFAQLVVLACIAAPIVEETVFRGLMYRQLRGASRRLSQVMSILLSALISATIFAAIHPQGFLALPALASIGFALALMREWRGTLIPSMIMHGISNAVAMTALWVIMNL